MMLISFFEKFFECHWEYLISHYTYIHIFNDFLCIWLCFLWHIINKKYWILVLEFIQVSYVSETGILMH